MSNLPTRISCPAAAGPTTTTSSRGAWMQHWDRTGRDTSRRGAGRTRRRAATPPGRPVTAARVLLSPERRAQVTGHGDIPRSGNPRSHDGRVRNPPANLALDADHAPFSPNPPSRSLRVAQRRAVLGVPPTGGRRAHTSNPGTGRAGWPSRVGCLPALRTGSVGSRGSVLHRSGEEVRGIDGVVRRQLRDTARL